MDTNYSLKNNVLKNIYLKRIQTIHLKIMSKNICLKWIQTILLKIMSKKYISKKDTNYSLKNNV